MGCSQAAPLRPVWRRQPRSSEVPNTLGHFFAPNLILWNLLLLGVDELANNGPSQGEQIFGEQMGSWARRAIIRAGCFRFTERETPEEQR